MLLVSILTGCTEFIWLVAYLWKEFTRLRCLSITTDFCFSYTAYGRILDSTHKIQFDRSSNDTFFSFRLPSIHFVCRAIAFCCCHNFSFQLVFCNFSCSLNTINCCYWYKCVDYSFYMLSFVLQYIKLAIYSSLYAIGILLALWLESNISHTRARILERHPCVNIGSLCVHRCLSSVWRKKKRQLNRNIWSAT